LDPLRLGTDLLARVNSLLPKRDRSACAQSYSQTQYRWAQGDLAVFGDLLDLRDMRVLDGGCGPGGKTVFFGELGCAEIIGIDAEARSIEAARAFAEARGAANVSFQVARLEALPFPDESFDRVLLTDVVEHIARPLLGPSFSEIFRVLRKGGELALYFPPWTSFDASHLYDVLRIPWCQVLFGDETLIALLERAHTGERAALDRMIAHYKSLNRITIEEFDDLLSESGFDVRFRRLRTIKNLPMPRARGLERYLVKRVVAVVRRPV
jgi:SAM-dependent methyltransferase